LMVHCYLIYDHEQRYNRSRFTRTLMTYFIPILFIAILVAPTSSIARDPKNCPHTSVNASVCKIDGRNLMYDGKPVLCNVPMYPDGGCYGWFNGTRCFQIVFGVWMLIMALIAWQAKAWREPMLAGKKDATWKKSQKDNDRLLPSDDDHLDPNAVVRDRSLEKSFVSLFMDLSPDTTRLLDAGLAGMSGLLMIAGGLIDISGDPWNSLHSSNNVATVCNCIWIGSVGLWTQFDYQQVNYFVSNTRTEMSWIKQEVCIPSCCTEDDGKTEEEGETGALKAPSAMPISRDVVETALTY